MAVDTTSPDVDTTSPDVDTTSPDVGIGPLGSRLRYYNSLKPTRKVSNAKYIYVSPFAPHISQSSSLSFYPGITMILSTFAYVVLTQSTRGVRSTVSLAETNNLGRITWSRKETNNNSQKD